MSLEVIYVARHGFRSNWLVDPKTGNYTAYIMSPTGIAADPALTSHGVSQATELGAHLAQIDSSSSALPPIERVYCSPYYRCLQTVQPFVEMMEAEEKAGHKTASPDLNRPPRWWSVRCERGLVDWFGPAPFEHPQPLPVAELQQDFFAWIDAGHADDSAPHTVPPRQGESMAQLHARMAAAMAHIVRECDAEGVRSILVCSHAAPIIAMGRALTGNVPADVETEDFGTFTCGLSVYRRRKQTNNHTRQHPVQQMSAANSRSESSQATLPTPSAPFSWDDQFGTLSRQPWIGGHGIGGGWDIEVNCDCSFLKGGEERGWRFSGDDESFASPERQSQPIQDAGLELGVVIKGRTTDQAQNLHEGLDVASQDSPNANSGGSGSSGHGDTTSRRGPRL